MSPPALLMGSLSQSSGRFGFEWTQELSLQLLEAAECQVGRAFMFCFGAGVAHLKLFVCVCVCVFPWKPYLFFPRVYFCANHREQSFTNFPFC